MSEAYQYYDMLQAIENTVLYQEERNMFLKIALGAGAITLALPNVLTQSTMIATATVAGCLEIGRLHNVRQVRRL